MEDMARLGRPAAIGVTSVALLLAATASSLAAVRAVRYDGVVPSGVALPAPAGVLTGPGAGLPPLAGGGLPDDHMPAPAPASAAPPGDPSAPGSTAAPGSVEAPPPAADAPPPAASPAPAVAAARGSTRPRLTVPTLGPVAGPTPTTAPNQPLACPGDLGAGALPVRAGQLAAVDFDLPWPALVPLVLLPQASAPRAPGVPVTIAGASQGVLGAGGSSLTLTTPLPVTYVLEAGGEQARGSVRFSAPVLPLTIQRRACRSTSFNLYDVGRRSLDGSPLRIVGIVAPAGTVTLSGNGGTAHFRSATPGVHQVVLLTASDAGRAGPVVNATIVVP